MLLRAQEDNDCQDHIINDGEDYTCDEDMEVACIPPSHTFARPWAMMIIPSIGHSSSTTTTKARREELRSTEVTADALERWAAVGVMEEEMVEGLWGIEMDLLFDTDLTLVTMDRLGWPVGRASITVGPSLGISSIFFPCSVP